MVNDGRGLRLSHLLGVALVVGGLSWIGWNLYLGRGGLLPPAPWVSAVLLAVMAALVFAAGLPVRRFLRGQATRPLSPIRAARTVVLAQAAALTGAGVLGFYGAELLIVLPDLDIPSYSALAWRLAALCAGALLLACSGMAVQRMCRIDRGDRDERGGRGDGREPWEQHGERDEDRDRG
ncbi:MAG TPA: DUF3180 domain-containing protein [Pedococcus sp.]|jgi:hypothetical protein|uniref:DUF3180 domain-containing protein n=1 Tax=Pedococcus sp. TaxID=2860345 RepID=UPI002F91CBD6